MSVTVHNIDADLYDGVYGIFYDGSLTIKAFGGTAPYHYDIINFDNDNGYFTYLQARNYSIIVTDANGQTSDTTVTISLINPLPTVNFSNIVIASSCSSADGSFTLLGSGGTPPYTYSIDGGVTFTSNNTFTNLTQGAYGDCLLKDSKGMLAVIGTFPISGYPMFFAPSNCAFTLETYQVGTGSCLDSVGAIEGVTTGAVRPVQFSIDGINYYPGDYLSPTDARSFYTFDHLNPGLYHIYAKDATGKIELASSEVALYCHVKITYISVDASCHQSDGSLTITATNGTAPYTYTMDGINYQTSNIFSGLASGIYTVSVMDANGIVNSGSAVVYNKCPVISATDTNEVCSNSNGSILVSGTKGTRPYRFSLDNGIHFQTDSLFSGLHAGNYKVLLKDANGFMDSTSIIIKNNCLLVSAVTTNKTCGVNNGTITATGTGGTPTYRYSIDGIHFQYSNVFNGLDSGTYILTIEDEYTLTDTTKVIVTNTPIPALNLGNDTTLCSCQTLNIVPVISGTVTSYKWQDGSTNNNYTVSRQGQYWLKVNMSGCTVNDTINVAYLSLPNSIFFTKDTTLCVGSSITLNAGNSGATYIWDDNTIQQTRTINSSGKYWVKVNTNGCSVSDTITCHFINGPLINLGNDTTLCSNQKLLINPVFSNATYLWSNNTTADSLLITSAGKYWLAATTNGCSNSDTIQVAYNPVPFIALGNDTTVCTGKSIILKGPVVPNYQYLWQDNSTANNYVTIKTGVYSLKVTNQFNCSTTDSISIVFNPIPVFNLGNDTSICNGKSLNLHTSLVGNYLWNTGSTNSFLNINTGGLYWLQVTQLGCTKADSIIINYKPNPSVDLGNDSTLCEGHTLLLDATAINASYLWQDGSQQPTYLVNNSGKYFVKVTVNGCDTTGQLDVNYISAPSINLGKDTTICISEKLLLNAGFPQSSYLWQDGAIQSTYGVTKEGKYLVTITNECGISKDSINVNYQNCACEFYIPSAFTPNNDSKNDIFKPTYQCLFSGYSLSIYNRNGQMIFESQDPDYGWNGTFYGQPENEGAYVWMIKYLDSVTGKSVIKKGSVVLIR